MSINRANFIIYLNTFGRKLNCYRQQVKNIYILLKKINKTFINNYSTTEKLIQLFFLFQNLKKRNIGF